jgi:hypothetical protein
MSGQLKKAWVTEHDAGLAMLSLECSNPGGAGPHCDERTFPAKPSPEHPMRRVIVVGLLDEDDLILIRDTINEILVENHHDR